MPYRLVFRNKGLIDLEAITTFGVSVKKGDNPIGKFGTGFKYAVAAVLRESSRCYILRGKEIYIFYAQEHPIRGKDFKVVYMQKPNGTPSSCGFTTELGKNWQPWMAIREFYSNAIDEDGEVLPDNAFPQPEEGVTQVVLQGEMWADLWAKGGFLLDKTLPVVEEGELLTIYDKPSKFLYQRGIRVFEAEKPYRYTYDFHDSLYLTEDRTIAYPWQANDYICRTLLLAKNLDLWVTLFGYNADRKSFAEHSLSFPDGYSASKEALAAIRKLREPPASGAPAFSTSYYGFSGIDHYYKKAKKEQIESLEEVAATADEASQMAPVVRVLVEHLKLFESVYFTRGLTLADGLHWDKEYKRIYFPIDQLPNGQKSLLFLAFTEYLKNADDEEKAAFLDKMANMAITAYLKG